MSKIEINYIPHPKQKIFHESKALYRLLCTGAGFGKTSAGVNELIRGMVKESTAGCVWAMAAPTHKMIKRVIIPEFYKWCPQSIIKSYNKNEQEIVLLNEVKVIGVAGDNRSQIDKARGLTLGGIYGDEIALDRTGYLHEILIERLRDIRGPLKLFYTTTPKGIDWTYRIWMDKLRKDGAKLKNPEEYEIFGGTTRDNPYTPEQYKQNLESNYTGNFAKQELEGKYVKFEGLVYQDFDQNVHIVKDEDLPANFKDMIGGIDWGVNNPNVALFIGVDNDMNLWILDEIFESQITIEEFRKMVIKTNKVWNVSRFYADPSGAGGILDFNNYEIACMKANNEVMVGISEVMNYLRKGKNGLSRLFVHQRCINTIKEFLLYRYHDSSEGQSVKENPYPFNDHCLIGDTKVLTKRGNIKIKNVRKGDFVLTRKGWCKVLKSWLTRKNVSIYRLVLSNCRVLEGTGNHPVYVKNKGFIRMDALSNAYIVVDAISNIWEQLFTMGIDTIKIKKVVIGNLMEIGKREDWNQVYIDKFGKTILELYLKDFKSIIKMETKTIMLLEILKVLKKDYIKVIIAEERKSVKNIIKKWLKRQKNGIEARKVLTGIEYMERILGKADNQLKRNALSVDRSLMIGLVEILLNIAIPLIAKRKHIGVRSVKKVGKADVYNLHVSDHNEFFANGILVHNSMDALRYAVMSLFQSDERGKPESFFSYG